ncbi:PTS sugar transporter subunit IIA [Radiobacillus kanasensis]|uniref:PTS sugar transporter subunit IIA n=1 Tax=Radiobacillus kanasensis TaxID=2844358 RepID=UPI001E33D6FA|nr:PTS sugar transporter subunit IIA [Radiobacillus kanasensis]UFT99596.1 PTS sugar transporter subunit IIA [Radiobacillus kanasensis]
MSSFSFDESLILTDIDVSSKEEVIALLANNLCEKGFVKESYVAAVLKREQTYATGLPTNGCSVAIPHTDIEHVNKRAISLGIIKETVDFGIMGEQEDTTPVKLVFMLATDEEHSQLSLLQRLMLVFQDKELLLLLSTEKDKTKIKEIIEENLQLSLKGGE